MQHVMRTGLRRISGDADRDQLAAHDTVCTAVGCKADADPEAPAPVCEEHTRLVFAYVMGRLQEHSGEVVDPQPAVLPYRDVQLGFVYFMRIGAEIKIGWTSYPTRRFKELHADEVLHVQRGTTKDERRLHAAFAHLRVHGEYFTPGPDLLALIADLKQAAS